MTEQQRNELFQKQCERFLSTCPVALCLARIADGQVVKLNERFLILAEAQDRGSEDLKTATLRIWTDSADEEQLRRRVLELKTLRDIVVHFALDPSGRPQTAKAGITCLEFAGEECLLVFLEEDTESKKVEQALAKARDAALESARLKSEFLTNISHEIRTPLNGVIGMTTLLRDTKLGSLQRNLTETIRMSADNLLNLINEILDFSKLEAGKLVVDSAPFNLLAMVENTLDLLAERAHSGGLELAYLVDSDVPVHLMGDAGRIRQVLTNLLANAIKFTAEGEVWLRVMRDTAPGRVRFEIHDTGIGIPERSLPDLFQAFHQVDSSLTRRYEGTGLGLAISRQLVEAMGGSIGVESSNGKGSLFWFCLPLSEQENQPEKAAFPNDLHGKRILLVEDSETNARNILTVLHQHGLDAKHIQTGKGALSELQTAAGSGRPYHLAIVDLEMPDMDGLTLSRFIKSEQSIAAISILMLTTVTHQVETTLLTATNIDACLTKPLKQSRILDYLQAALTHQSPKHSAAANLPGLSVETPAPAPLRIIIAEDNGINQKVAKGLLNRLGYVADVVADGRSLLRALELSPRDVVLMDCQLPEMDGLKATAEIRNRERTSGSEHRTYVIAMTADAVPGARDRCIKAGMDDYLSKPIRLEELQSVLRRAVEYIHLSSRNGSHQHPQGYIDPLVMDTLRLLRMPGTPDPLPQLINEFISAAQHRLEQLQSAMIDRDIDTIETAAHSLRGSSAGIGAMRLADLSAEMENGVRNGSFHSSAGVLSQMDEEFLLVKNALEFEKTR